MGLTAHNLITVNWLHLEGAAAKAH